MSDTNILKLLVRLKDKFRCSSCKSYIKQGTELSCGDQICKHCYKKGFCPVCNKKAEDSKSDKTYQRMLNFLHNCHDQVQMQYNSSDRDEDLELNEFDKMFVDLSKDVRLRLAFENSKKDDGMNLQDREKTGHVVDWLNETKNNFTASGSQTDPNGFEIATAQTDFSDFDIDSDDSSTKDKNHSSLNQTEDCCFCSPLSHLIDEIDDNQLFNIATTSLDRKTIEELEDEFLNQLDDFESESTKIVKKTDDMVKTANVDANDVNNSTKFQKASPDFPGWENKPRKRVEKKKNRPKLNIDKGSIRKKSLSENRKLCEPVKTSKSELKSAKAVEENVIVVDSASEGDIRERVTPICDLSVPLPITGNGTSSLYFQPASISTITEEECSDDIGDKENAIASVLNILEKCYDNLDNKKTVQQNLNKVKIFLQGLENRFKVVHKSVQTVSNHLNKSAQTVEIDQVSEFVQTSFKIVTKDAEVQAESDKSIAEKGIATVSKPIISSGMQTLNCECAGTQYVDVSRLLADPFLKSAVLNKEVENALSAVKSLSLNVSNEQKFIENYKKLIGLKNNDKKINRINFDVVDEFSTSSSSENKIVSSEIRLTQTDLVLSRDKETAETQTNLKINRSCQKFDTVAKQSSETFTTNTTASSCQNIQTDLSVNPKQRKSKFTCHNVTDLKEISTCQNKFSELDCSENVEKEYTIEKDYSLKAIEIHPAKHSHNSNLKTLYTLRDNENVQLQSRLDKEDDPLREAFLDFEKKFELASLKQGNIKNYSQENEEIENLLSTPFLEDFDTQAIIEKSEINKLPQNQTKIKSDSVEKSAVFEKNSTEQISKDSDFIKKTKKCLSQFKRFKRIRTQDNSDSDVDENPQKKSCPKLIRDDLSVEFDSNQLTEQSLDNEDYEAQLEKLLKNYDETNEDNPFRKSTVPSTNSDKPSNRNSRTPVREFPKEISASDLRNLSPIKRCHDVLEKTNKIIRDGKFDEKSQDFPVQQVEKAGNEKIDSQLDGSDIIFESEKFIEEAKLRKVAPDAEKLSESLFSPTGGSTSFCLSRKRSSASVLQTQNPLSDGLDDLMNKEVDILSAKAATEMSQNKKQKCAEAEAEENILLNDPQTERPDIDVISSSDMDILSVSDEEEIIVETTPQKSPLKIPKKVNKVKPMKNLSIISSEPEELDVTAIEVDAETNNELMSLTAIENCVSINKMDSILHKSAISISPIKKSAPSFTEIAHSSKYNPLVVVKSKPASSQIILTSTPRQKSIRNYLVEETTNQAKVARICVIASRLTSSQLAQIMELEKRNLIQYSANFNCKSTTHIVVNPDERNCIMELTLKMLWAITYGIWVVKFDWVKESLQKNCIVDEAPFEVLDMYGGNGPKLSRLSKNSRDVFKGYALYFANITYQNEFKSMVRYLKGEIIEKLTDIPKFHKSHYCLIITNSENLKDGSADVYQKWRNTFKVLILDQEWLSNSIMFCKVINVREHLLCFDNDIEEMGYPADLVAGINTTSNTTITNNY